MVVRPPHEFSQALVKLSLDAGWRGEHGDAATLGGLAELLELHLGSMRKSLILEKGEVLLRGVGTLRYVSILSEDSACQVPICAVAA